MTTNQTNITEGSSVRLPDGETGVVQSITGDEAEIIQWHKTIGRGPWIFPVAQLQSIEAAS